MKNTWKVAFLLLLPLTSYAADWVLVSKNPGYDLVYMDKSTINGSPAERKAWLLWDLSEDKSFSNGKTYRSYKAYIAFDCNNRTYVTRNITYYSQFHGNGQVVDRRSIMSSEHAFDDFTPHTVLEMAFNAVCHS
jgi:hypothetical protein